MSNHLNKADTVDVTSSLEKLSALFEAINRLARNPHSTPDSEIMALSDMGSIMAVELRSRLENGKSNG